MKYAITQLTIQNVTAGRVWHANKAEVEACQLFLNKWKEEQRENRINKR